MGVRWRDFPAPVGKRMTSVARIHRNIKNLFFTHVYLSPLRARDKYSGGERWRGWVAGGAWSRFNQGYAKVYRHVPAPPWTSSGRHAGSVTCSLHRRPHPPSPPCTAGRHPRHRLRKEATNNAVVLTNSRATHHRRILSLVWVGATTGRERDPICLCSTDYANISM